MSIVRADFQTFHSLSSIKSADEVKIIVDVEFHFLFRSSRPDVFCEKGVLRNFAKFTGKHLCQSLVFNKVAGTACNFTKKEILAQVFSSEFCEISKNTLFNEHLQTTASVQSNLREHTVA